MAESLRARSKRDYTSDNGTLEDLRTGAILRIADASELMAKNYSELQFYLDYYKAGYKNRGQAIKSLRLSNAALKGVITKLKKKPRVPVREEDKQFWENGVVPDGN